MCRPKTSSLSLLPMKLSFSDGVHYCSKLSGIMAQYTTEDEYNVITHFLTGKGPSSSEKCGESWQQDGRQVEVDN